MEYIKLNKGIKDAVEMLTPSEAGALFKAILGCESTLFGSAVIAYGMLKPYIEECDQPVDYQTQMRENGKKGGRPRKNQENQVFEEENQVKTRLKPAFSEKNQVFQEEETAPLPPSSPSPSPTPLSIPPIIPQPPKEEEGYDDGDGNARAWVTDEEIHESLERDRQIEEAAKAWGLPVNEGVMILARDLADKYTLPWLVDAIEKAGCGKEQTWRYVQGILRRYEAQGGIDDSNPRQKPVKVVSAQQYEQRQYTEKGLDNGDLEALLNEARAARDG